MKDAIEGREVLKSLASHSMAADRCSATLEIIFKRLPTWMREGRPNPAATKKRSFQEGTEHPQSDSNQSPLSYMQSFMGAQEPPPFARRAATFPQMGTQNPHNAVTSYPESWAQMTPAFTSGMTSPNGSYDSSLLVGVAQQPLSNSVNGVLPQYTGQQGTKQPELTDLSNMIFPAANEPFLYPNQPLTTFENRQQFDRANSYMMNGPKTAYSNIDADSRPTSNPRSEEDIEAQFFALPPYLQQQQQQQPQSQITPPLQGQQSRSNPYSTSQPMSYNQAGAPLGQTVPMSAEEWQAAQGLRQEIQNMFGSNEWNPMAGGYPSAS
jgi:hypothetical protein